MALFYMIETSVMKELNMIAIKGFCELAFWTLLFCQKFYKVTSWPHFTFVGLSSACKVSRK